MFKLILSKQVLKFVKSRNRKEKNLIETKFELLRKAPTNHDLLDIKQMQGFENVYRLRILK